MVWARQQCIVKVLGQWVWARQQCIVKVLGQWFVLGSNVLSRSLDNGVG